MYQLIKVFLLLACLVTPDLEDLNNHIILVTQRENSGFMNENNCHVFNMFLNYPLLVKH